MRKRTGRAVTMPVGLAWGAVANILGTLAGAVIAAKLMDAGTIKENTVGYAVLITLLLSSYIGSKVAVNKIKRQRVVVCVLSGLVYFLVLLSMTALLFGGQYEAVGVTGVLVAGGSMLAVVNGAPSKRGGRPRKIGKVNG